DRFPFYKANDERWKNSIRHNLSINPHFRKGARAPQGAGHLWSLAANAIDLLPCNPVPEEKTSRVPVLETEMKFMGFQKRRPPRCRMHKSLAANGFNLLPYNPVPEKKIPRLSVLRETDFSINLFGFPKVIVLDEAAIAAASILPDQDLYTGG
ncbi:putative forkhead box protein, partial [Operophtera brumata]